MLTWNDLSILNLNFQVNKTRDKLYEYQKQLEDEQREEEDRMMVIFQDERRKEAERMEKELQEEWEGKLQELTSKFDKNPAGERKDKDVSFTMFLSQGENRRTPDIDLQ